MRDTDINIVELIIQTMPEENELQSRIKFYMQAHQTNCNNFIYSKFKQETTFFNTILKSLKSDLSAEIVRVLQKNIS